MNTLKFLTNNNGTMEATQNKIDREITIHVFHGFNDFSKTKDDIKIPASDMVMLINLYRYIKENDIQNDFINPCGKNKEWYYIGSEGLIHKKPYPKSLYNKKC